jgi:hypothetical protein
VEVQVARSSRKQLKKAAVDPGSFNKDVNLPFNLRLDDFRMAMQDVYDFLSDTNDFLVGKGLPRLDDTLRKAILSGVLSDMLTDAMAKHARNMARNMYHNGHPDLLVGGVYPEDSVKSGTDGIEIKATKKKGGAVDTHGARDQTMCIFVYKVDADRKKSVWDRDPLEFKEIYIFGVKESDFRFNDRSRLGTRTATLDKSGIKKLRSNWVYRKE